VPELPEVETIARTLREGGQGREPLPGRVIERAHLLWARTLAEPAAEIFLARLPGQVVQGVDRRGKYLILRLSRDALLVHLRMSGDMITGPVADEQGAPVPPAPHDRLLLDFAGNLRVAFNDARKFGRAWLVPDPEMVTAGLGPEPLSAEFTPELLHQRLQACDRQIKPLLLDQTFLAGLGNIYTDEALFAAGIHPLRRSRSITREEAGRLWAAIRAALAEGIRRNGASIDWVYRGGGFQDVFQVYQRTGKACPACGAPIVRITVGQRGTHYCPHCQAE
jgi:formamidopyrimidine-DNA glycosylase